MRQELDRNRASTSSCGEGGVVWQLTPNLFHINPNQASSPWETSPECQGGPESDPNLGEWWECLCLLSGHFPTAWERLQIGGLAISRPVERGLERDHPAPDYHDCRLPGGREAASRAPPPCLRSSVTQLKNLQTNLLAAEEKSKIWNMTVQKHLFWKLILRAVNFCVLGSLQCDVRKRVLPKYVSIPLNWTPLPHIII